MMPPRQRYQYIYRLYLLYRSFGFLLLVFEHQTMIQHSLPILLHYPCWLLMYHCLHLLDMLHSILHHPQLPLCLYPDSTSLFLLYNQPLLYLFLDNISQQRILSSPERKFVWLHSSYNYHRM